MQTDIPLKRLTAICAADLLPLLGVAGMELVRVGVLELPQTAAALDTVLWLRDRRGRVHLHLVEWQGYRDPLFLWRLMGYLSWVGLHHPERPITITPIYLRPGDDAGSSLRQGLEGSWRAGTSRSPACGCGSRTRRRRWPAGRAGWRCSAR